VRGLGTTIELLSPVRPEPVGAEGDRQVNGLPNGGNFEGQTSTKPRDSTIARGLAEVRVWGKRGSIT
jgi:hypothetical protein